MEHAIRRLTELSAKDLRSLAVRCGSTSSGTKRVIAQQLMETTKQRVTKSNDQVLSIDMGLKNIGVCQIGCKVGVPNKFVVNKWHLATLGEVPFAYPQFANAAFCLVESLTKSVPAPATIIIERQRSRSGGAAAVPQEIVKINVLEGIIHGILLSKYPHIGVESVNPKHVLGYWKDVLVDKDEVKEDPKSAYRLAKKARFKLVREWLANRRHSPFEFDSKLVQTEGGKRDDLNDSLVQAVTWMQWRHNSDIFLRALKEDLDIYEMSVSSNRVFQLPSLSRSNPTAPVA